MNAWAMRSTLTLAAGASGMRVSWRLEGGGDRVRGGGSALLVEGGVERGLRASVEQRSQGEVDLLASDVGEVLDGGSPHAAEGEIGQHGAVALATGRLVIPDPLCGAGRIRAGHRLGEPSGN